MNRIYHEVHHCRIFPEQPLEVFFDMGLQPPANSLRRDKSEPLPQIPLVLGWSEQAKSVQLTVDVDSEYLFKHYVWVTGTSQTAKDYAQYFCQQFLQRTPEKQPFIVEMASNDGTFLKPFIERGIKVLGVDPAANIAQAANAQGIPTLADFFNAGSAQHVIDNYGQCDGFIARNVIPHVEHIDEIMQSLVRLLSDEGIGAFEFHYAGKIFDELHYDSVYHEHLFYHSLTSMQNLLNKYGFFPFDLFQSPISGGSYVIFFSKKSKEITDSLRDALQHEMASGINDLASWKNFAQKSLEHAKSLREALDAELAAGRRVIGYGASARSSTLLNFAGIDAQYLTCIADKSPYKHYCYTAGTDIQILPPAEALATKPDTILLLAWNFEQEIVQELQQTYGFTGKVIVPLPGPVREVWINAV